MFTYVDLFCGAGGLSLGLKAAGFTCRGVVESEVRAAESYRQNFAIEQPGVPLCRLGPEEGNIRGINLTGVARDLSEEGLPPGNLDLLAAGPPCQGFSQVGRSKLNSLAQQRDAFRHDTRNQLYLGVVDLLSVLQPRAFIVENVTGVLNLGGVNVAERMIEAAERHGYCCRVAVLNAAWYGVPQTRERVFILGFREDLGITPSLPVPHYAVESYPGQLAGSDWVKKLFVDDSRLQILTKPGPGAPSAISAQEAIGELPPLFDHLANGYSCKKAAQSEPLPYPATPIPGSYEELMRTWPDLPESTEVLDHYSRCTPRDHETFRYMEHGDRYPDAVAVAEERYAAALGRYRESQATTDEAMPEWGDYVPPYSVDSFEEKWRKLIPRQPSWTVTAHLCKDGYSHIHFDSAQARTITPREAARLQSFPDAFRFSGNMGDKFRQIGNAVPPLLAAALGHQIQEALESCDRTVEDQRQAETVAPHSTLA